jgi:hypothetical protein
MSQSTTNISFDAVQDKIKDWRPDIPKYNITIIGANDAIVIENPNQFHPNPPTDSKINIADTILIATDAKEGILSFKIKDKDKEYDIKDLLKKIDKLENQVKFLNDTLLAPVNGLQDTMGVFY